MNKFYKIILSFSIVFSFTAASSDAVQAKSNSQYAKPYSKIQMARSAKNKNVIRTYNYKTVKNNKARVAKASTRVKFTSTLRTASPYIGATYANSIGFSGQDVYVAIIDTGIEKAHPFFQDRVALEACFSSMCPNRQKSMIGPGAAVPVHYHGTHVAGIVGGSNNVMQGAAPRVKFIAINVFDPFGGAYDSDIVKALNWLHSISDQYNIASVNMSLGGSLIFKQTCDNYIPSMTTAIKNLKDKNIATVVASGNSYAVGMSAPACISHAVSVAAMNTATGKVTDFSNVSQYTTLSAPGAFINSSKLMGSYGSASGTSMAAPFVAGAFAVYRSRYGVQSVDKVVSDFQTYSVPSIDDFSKIVTKRIDLRLVLTQTQTPPPSTTTTIPTTTTSTTIPVVTTTTVPSSTTTTLPSITTTTTVPTSPVTPSMIGKPELVSLYTYSSDWRSYSYDVFIVTYKDVFYGKSLLTHYVLTCDNNQTYDIPVRSGRLHSYRLRNADGSFLSSKGIKNCFLQGASNNVLGPKTWYLDVTK